MELIIVWFFCAIGGAMALSRFNKAGIGFLLGLLLGPFGLLFALIWRSNLSADRAEKGAQKLVVGRDGTVAVTPARDERPCPFCAESILAAARVCKHCGRDVPADQVKAA